MLFGVIVHSPASRETGCQLRHAFTHACDPGHFRRVGFRPPAVQALSKDSDEIKIVLTGINLLIGKLRDEKSSANREIAGAGIAIRLKRCYERPRDAHEGGILCACVRQ